MAFIYMIQNQKTLLKNFLRKIYNKINFCRRISFFKSTKIENSFLPEEKTQQDF